MESHKNWFYLSFSKRQQYIKPYNTDPTTLSYICLTLPSRHKTWVRQTFNVATSCDCHTVAAASDIWRRLIVKFQYLCKVCEGHQKIWHFRVKELVFILFYFILCATQKVRKNSSEIENLSILFVLSSLRDFWRIDWVSALAGTSVSNTSII